MTATSKRTKQLIRILCGLIDKRLEAAFTTLSLTKQHSKISRQIFWNIVINLPFPIWEREIKFAILLEAAHANASLKQTRQALAAAGCDTRFRRNFAAEIMGTD